MKTQFTMLAFLLAAMPFWMACDQVSGSGRVATESRQIKSFSRIHVQGSMDVYITKGTGGSAKVEAEDNILPLIELEEDGDVLRVRFKNNVNIRTTKDIKVFLSAEKLQEIELSGSGDIKLESHFTSDVPVEVSVAGSGDIEAGFTAPAISINVAGSGNADVKGETRDLNVDVAGSGNCNASDLMAETAEVSIAGSGDVKLHASNSLSANIVGSGNVYYKGEPSLNVSKIGSGSVQKR